MAQLAQRANPLAIEGWPNRALPFTLESLLVPLSTCDYFEITVKTQTHQVSPKSMFGIFSPNPKLLGWSLSAEPTRKEEAWRGTIEHPTRNKERDCRQLILAQVSYTVVDYMISDVDFLMFAQVSYTVVDYMITRLHDYMILDVCSRSVHREDYMSADYMISDY